MPTRSTSIVIQPRWLVSLLLLLACCAGVHAEEAAGPVAPPAPTPESSAEPGKALEEPALTGRFVEQAGQRVLTLWGTPRERGFAHGYLLAKPLLDGIEHDFSTVMRPFLPLYQSAVRSLIVPRFAFAPNELAEMEGLLAGVRARVGQAGMVVPALGREVDLLDVKALNTFGDWYGLGCSSLAVWGPRTTDGAPLVGRNFDFPGFELVIRHQMVVVRADAEGRAGSVGVTHPGSIGLMTGMSRRGLFVSIHDVRVKPTLAEATRANVPRLLAVRRLLEQVEGDTPIAAAQALLATWPTLYGNNLMVAAPRAVEGAPIAGVFEYDSRQALDGGLTARTAGREPGELHEAQACMLVCTNHHRARDEAKSALAQPFKRWRYPELLTTPAEPYDVARLFARMERVAFPREGVQTLAADLNSKVTGRGFGTLHQCVAEPAALRLHIRLGALGKHIRDVKPIAYPVGELVRATALTERAPQAAD